MDFSKEQVDYRLLLPALQVSSRHPQRTICCPVDTSDNEVGAALSHLMGEIYGDHTLPDDKIVVHFRGLAGRNFGAGLCQGVTFVADGIGKNGCHGMKGGRVVLLSMPDAPFATGMTGGTIYIYAPNGSHTAAAALSKEETDAIHALLEEHGNLVPASIANTILKTWPDSAKDFVKITAE